MCYVSIASLRIVDTSFPTSFSTSGVCAMRATKAARFESSATSKSYPTCCLDYVYVSLMCSHGAARRVSLCAIMVRAELH